MTPEELQKRLHILIHVIRQGADDYYSSGPTQSGKDFTAAWVGEHVIFRAQPYLDALEAALKLAAERDSAASAK